MAHSRGLSLLTFFATCFALRSLGGQWLHRPPYRNVVMDSAVLHRIAENHGVSIPTLVMSWQLQLGMAVVPRSKAKAHTRENSRLRFGSSVSLSSSEMREIDMLDGTAEKAEPRHPTTTVQEL